MLNIKNEPYNNSTYFFAAIFSFDALTNVSKLDQIVIDYIYYILITYIIDSRIELFIKAF